MEQGVLAIVAPFCLILIFSNFCGASGNAEGDALNALRSNLFDPNGVLQSWDSTLVNPCKWFHVTCDSDNSVTRVDLGNANLTGSLVPQLGNLANLQYLELYSNNISGSIPVELGNLTSLVSLDLYLNSLSGPIPYTLGNLKRLRFLRLNNNSLTGEIPMSLTTITALQVLDLSYNHLRGTTPVNGSFQLFTPISFAGNPELKPPPMSPPPPIQPKSDSPSGEKLSGFDRNEDFTSDFKEDKRFEEAPSIRDSKTAENGTRTGMRRPARPCTPGRRATKPAHQCSGARTCVPGARPCA